MASSFLLSFDTSIGSLVNSYTYPSANDAPREINVSERTIFLKDDSILAIADLLSESFRFDIFVHQRDKGIHYQDRK